MQARRVLISLEVETDSPIQKLREGHRYSFNDWDSLRFKVEQIQVNVIRKEAYVKDKRPKK